MKTTSILSLLISAFATSAADGPTAGSTVRTGRVISVGARLERIDPALLRGSGHSTPTLFLPLLQSDSPTIVPTGFDAEPINIRAMLQYQHRWEAHTTDPKASPKPALYPSRVEQVFERTK